LIVLCKTGEKKCIRKLTDELMYNRGRMLEVDDYMQRTDAYTQKFNDYMCNNDQTRSIYRMYLWKEQVRLGNSLEKTL
jgi:hypothetical protein